MKLGRNATLRADIFGNKRWASHGTCRFFANLTSCGHTGCSSESIALDPASSNLDPKTLPPGTPVPFGAPVSGRLAANGNRNSEIVDGATLSVVATFDASTWIPPGTSPPIEIVSGTNGFVAIYYPVLDSGAARAYCARLNRDGVFLGASDCSASSNSLGSAAGVWASHSWGSSHRRNWRPRLDRARREHSRCRTSPAGGGARERWLRLHPVELAPRGEWEDSLGSRYGQLRRPSTAREACGPL